MCGRYSETKPISEIQKVYPFKLDKSFEPSYNLAPTQPGLVITADAPDLIRVMNFGLVPFWAKDKKVGFSMINARSESLLEKTAFKPLLLQNKRCLVLADGFYEWEKVGKEKLPYRFVLPDREVFAFAGLWSRWKDPETKEPYESFTIITTAPNDLVKPIHDRMPVILSKDDERAWLSSDIPADQLLTLLDAYPDEEMNKFRVSKEVNNVVNNHSDLLLPINSQ
jgi:putative SOS response-associated peptidase YedK